MDKWISCALTAAFSLPVGYLLGYLNHGLTQSREADSRKREFRNFVRTISLRFDSANWMKFIETYDESVPVVKEACIKIFEDIRFFRRRGFIKHRDIYCGLKHSDLQLPTTRCSPVDLPIRMQENKKMREKMTTVLKDTLEGIANHAD
jgi:hypothetical protein